MRPPVCSPPANTAAAASSSSGPRVGRQAPAAGAAQSALLAALLWSGGEGVFAAHLSAQGVERADSAVAAWVADGRIPGAVFLVFRDGAPVKWEAYGAAQSYDFGGGQYPGDSGVTTLVRSVPMTPETVFDLASVTKVMATTMAVMLLVDRGVLALDAPVATYLPDFTGGGKERVTLEHLLTHRSGLSQWQPTYYHASNATEAYAYIRELPLSWDVGAERHYSDLGFMMLGLVVEKVTGRTLDAFLRSELYRPLGLGQTGYRGSLAATSGGSAPYAATSHGNPFERRMVYDDGFGYRIEGDPAAWDGWRDYTLIGEVNDGNAHHAFNGLAGHAGLFSSADELTTLLQMLLSGGTLDGRRFLRQSTVDRFLESTGDDQALGWQVPPYAPAGAFAHTGFTGTFVLGHRGSGTSIVLLTNRQNGGVDADTAYPDVGPLQREVTAAVLGSR